MAKTYRVEKINPLFDPGPNAEFEERLNKWCMEGWELHSIIPQNDETGTYSNTVILVFDDKNT
ncbi:MAG: hypothetical protein ACM32O_07195 [Clostridia bacterium]